MIEIWKIVENCNDSYEVSSFGRVRNIKKQTFIGIPKNNLKVRYISVGINSKHYRVNRLVASVFIPNPKNKPYVNHIDNNTLNNHISNLEWCTQKENIQHSIKQGRFTRSKGEKQHSSKLKEKQVLEIRKLSKTKSRQYLANKYKVTIHNIACIINRKTWKHL